MYGITINGKHTYTEFGMMMIPFTDLSPLPKTTSLYLEGMNGSLDLTSLFGSTKYQDYNLQLDFDILCDYAEYILLNSRLKREFSGKIVECVFDNDIEYKRVGRLTNIQFVGDGNSYTTVSLYFTFFPFKKKVEKTEITFGVGESTYELTSGEQVTPTVTPNGPGVELIVNGSAKIALLNEETKVYDFQLIPGNNSIEVFGGSVTLKFNEGDL